MACSFKGFSHKRRVLLGLGTGLTFSVPALAGQIFNVRQEASEHSLFRTIGYYEVADNVALPAVALNDLLLVDGGVTSFTADGMYLYPAWGKPRPYFVKKAGSGETLEFYNPGTLKLLWSQSLNLSDQFAGKTLATLRSAEQKAIAQNLYPPIQIPEQAEFFNSQASHSNLWT